MRNLPASPVSLEASFEAVSRALLQELTPEETLALQLSGEESLFVRFNAGKVRQTGTVCEATLQGNLAAKHCQVDFSLPIQGVVEQDLQEAKERLKAARAMLAECPEDPFWVAPQDKGVSSQCHQGQFPAPEELPGIISRMAADLDFVGFYQGGRIVRAMMNSKGTRHWFATETFHLGYSLFLPSGRAVSATYAGREWKEEELRSSLDQARLHLEKLALPQREVPRGLHRVYLAPSAVTTLASFMLFGFGAASHRQKTSPLLGLVEGRESFSPKFHLTDDYSLGVVPRFCEDGTVSPETFPLVSHGQACNPYVSERSAGEYGLTSNGAGPQEYVRSPAIAAGDLPKADVLRALGNGLYISDLHYLNFSDRPNARVTGMTRFACFWVENGEIVAPIRDIRFDITLYQAFGKNLEALTLERELVVESSTYEHRDLGGFLAPGALVRDFEFTL